MRQVLADQHTEVEQLRAEITKWRQRVPKLAESLRLRADSLTHMERQNQRLREELASLRQQLKAEKTSKVTD